VRFTRLSGERKLGLRVWNTAQMMTSPTITGSAPRLPVSRARTSSRAAGMRERTTAVGVVSVT